MSVHAVLGAGGAIANATLAALRYRGLATRQLSRKDADARKTDQLVAALTGATHVYFCIGLPYRAKLWQSEFPAIMRAVLTACETVDAKLIFFDNIYMYGPVPLPEPITEECPQLPSSKKGKVRKEIADLVLQAHQEGRVDATIGRCADFYGPGARNSPLYIKFLENMLQGRRPQVLMHKGPVHTYAYTEDAGRALVELALHERSFGEVYHLPVGEPVTVEGIVARFNVVLGTDFEVVHLSKRALRFLSLFIPIIREAQEMNYQYASDYVLSDKKFRTQFPDFQTTDYDAGIEAMVESFHR